MLDQLLSAIPAEHARMAALAGVGGVAVGAFLWLFGSRFSQGLMALAMVAAGAWIGLSVPRWTSVPVSNWALATMAALLLGLVGFVLHRTLVGLSLAALAAAWTAGVLIAIYAAGLQIPMPAKPIDIEAYGEQLWQDIPEPLRHIGPMACGIAAVAALGIAVLWMRMAGYVFYSLLGVTLMLAGGMGAAKLARPALLDLVPGSPMARAGVLAALIGFGVLVQWRMAPRRKPAVVAMKDESDEDEPIQPTNRKPS